MQKPYSTFLKINFTSIPYPVQINNGVIKRLERKIEKVIFTLATEFNNLTQLPKKLAKHKLNRTTVI